MLWMTRRSLGVQVITLFIFVLFFFFVNRASFLVPDRHFALLLDFKMSLVSPVVEDEMPPELVDNPGTTRGTKFSV